MLTAADRGGRRKPLGAGVAGTANGVAGGTIDDGFASFEWWNRACDEGRIDPGTGILLLVMLPIRGIRDCVGSCNKWVWRREKSELVKLE